MASRVVLEGSDSECLWLNSLVTIVWPRVDFFLRNLMETRIAPAINEALPQVMKGALKIPRCSLGKATPKFSNFRVCDRSDEAIVLELAIDLKSDLDLQIRAMHLPLGIQSFTARGVLTVVLGPASYEPPFFAGIEIYFVNPPELDFDFTGAANIADMQVVKTVLQNTIRNQLKRFLVVPARIPVVIQPLNVDKATLKFPEPVGALRILVKNAKNLKGSDFNLTSSRTSDPYVTVELGQDFWKSSVVNATCNPVWEDGNIQDFLVYDTEQHIAIEVFDYDRIGSDDHLGSAKRLPVHHFTHGGKVHDETLELTDSEGPAGSLVISTRWFSFTDKVPSKGIAPAVARGPHQLFLSARIEDAMELPWGGSPPYTVVINVGEKHEVRTNPSHPPAIRRVPPEVMQVCARLHKGGMSVKDVARATGLSEQKVDACVSNDPKALLESGKAQMLKEGTQHPVWDQHVRVLLPWTEDVINESVRITLEDKHHQVVGSPVQLHVSDVIGKSLAGPFPILHGAELRARLCTKWFCLP